MKKNSFLLHLAMLLILSVMAQQAYAQTTEVYSDGNVRIIQQPDGWQVMHFAKTVAHGDGIIDVNNLPPAFKDFLDFYAGLPQAQSPRRSLSKNATITYGPLLQTQWNQSTPYNDLCPIIDDERAVTGCTTIATAQILNYYGYCKPFAASGSSSATGESISSDYISNVSISNSTINYDYSFPFLEPDFSNMDNSMLSKLILGIAFVQQATFGKSETSTYTYNQIEALKNTFGYQCEYYEIESLTDRSLIPNAIKHGCPVIISGRNSQGGHTFIIDGYNGDGEFHINYGWGGSYDGWFTYTQYPSSNAIIIAHPDDDNAALMQDAPKFLHISGNGINKTISMTRATDDLLTYQLSEPQDLAAGEYEFYFEYADGSTIAPYTSSSIVLQNTYSNYGRYVSTPATISLEKGYALDFLHNVGKGEVKIAVTDYDVEIRGRVLDENGNPLADVFVSNVNSTPQASVMHENINDLWGGVTRVPPVSFVATNKYITQIDYLIYCERGTPQSDIVLTLSDKSWKKIWEHTVPLNALRTNVWGLVTLDEELELTIGDDYYLSISAPGNDKENYWLIGCDENHDMMYRIWACDQKYTQTDANGNYAIKINKYYTGALYAIDSKNIFAPLQLDNLQKSLANQNFNGLTQKITISGRAVDEDGNALAGTLVSLSETMPQNDALNKNDDAFASNFMLFNPYSIDFVPTKKYLTQISFAVCKQGSPENILFDLKDEEGRIIWQTNLLDNAIKGYDWTDISLEEWIEVTPGKQYTLTLTTGANNDYENRYFYYKGSDGKIVYRIYSTDDIFVQADQDGNFEIKVDRYSTGTLHAFLNNYTFTPVEYTDVQNSYSGQKIIGLGKNVVISGKVQDAAGNAIQDAIVTTETNLPTPTIEKNSETASGYYYSRSFNDKYWYSEAFQLQKKYINSIEFHTAAYGSPGNITVALADKGKNILWQKSFTSSQIVSGGWTAVVLDNSVAVVPGDDYYLALYNSGSDNSNMYFYYCDDNNKMHYRVLTSDALTIHTDQNGLYSVQVPRYSSGKLYAFYEDKEFNTVDYIDIPSKATDKNFTEISKEAIPTSIEIATLPTKLTYIVGNSLDIDGGFITVKYNNNTTETVAISDANVSGFDNTKIGTQTLTVEYLGLTTTVEVTVNDRSATSIEIATLPSKLTYIVGNSLEIDGGFITVNYNNNTTEKVAISDANVSGFDNSKIGAQTLTVEYLGLTTTFEVTVNDRSATSIEIATLPSKLTYAEGDEIEINGGLITVSYNDNTSETVAISDANISGFDNSKIGSQTLTVEYLGLTATFEVTVEAKAEEKPVDDNPETATENIAANNIKIWSYDKTIVVENGGKKISIVDMSGRTIKNIINDNQRTEITMQKPGIYIVKTGVKTQKVITK